MYRYIPHNQNSILSSCGQFIIVYDAIFTSLYTNELKFVGQESNEPELLSYISSATCERNLDPRSKSKIDIQLYKKDRVIKMINICMTTRNIPNPQLKITLSQFDNMLFITPKTLHDSFRLSTEQVIVTKYKYVLILELRDKLLIDILNHVGYLLCLQVHNDRDLYYERVS